MSLDKQVSGWKWNYSYFIFNTNFDKKINQQCCYLSLYMQIFPIIIKFIQISQIKSEIIQRNLNGLTWYRINYLHNQLVVDLSYTQIN